MSIATIALAIGMDGDGKKEGDDGSEVPIAGLREDVLTVCCGGPGRNNYNGSVFCGDPLATTCGNPSGSLYWDGVHFTEAANRRIAAGWLTSIRRSSDARVACPGPESY